MIKRKYLYVLTFIVLFLAAFKLNTVVSSKEDDNVQHVEKAETVKPNPVSEIQDVITRYDSIITSEIKETGTVGAAVVVTYKNEIALLKCFGNKKAGSNDKIDSNTIFRLASVSKSVTGVLAGILEEEHIVNLDDKVTDYLPELKLKNPEYTKQLSVKHLLSHTSGLVPHAYDLMVEDHVSLEKIIERLDEVDITAPPGELYGYQNVMFSLYDPIASKKTNKSFQSLMKEKLFDPFGMKDASVGYEPFKNNENKAYPHYGGKNRFRPMRLNDRYYNTAPAAGVNASISDLGHMLLTLTDNNSEIFSEKAYDIVFTPQVKSPLKRSYFRSWDKVNSKQYSIGWRIVDYKGRKIAYHGGYVQGYRAEIAFCKEEEIGIAYLTNSPNSSVSKKVPTFLNLIFEQKDKLAEEKNKAEQTPENQS